MKIPFHRPIFPRDTLNDINNVLESGWVTTGKQTKLFEQKLSEYLNVNHVVALQATSPIRGKNDLDEAASLFTKKKYDSLFSSTLIRDYFVWRKLNKRLIPNYNYNYRKPRHQC